MDKLPCEDCITLPICKNDVITVGSYGWLMYLCDKCSILNNYILNKNFDLSVERHYKLAKYMTPKNFFSV